MRPQEQTVAAEECDAMTEMHAMPEVGESSGLRVRDITVIATRKVVQLTDDMGDAMVTTADSKGTFLVRRRQDRLPNACPLLCYEVRRLEVVGHRDQSDRPEYGQESDGPSRDENFVRRQAAVAGSGAR